MGLKCGYAVPSNVTQALQQNSNAHTRLVLGFALDQSQKMRKGPVRKRMGPAMLVPCLGKEVLVFGETCELHFAHL